MDAPEIKKKTTRTGRAIGKKDRARVSISMNDKDRNLSRLWELVKRLNSRRHERAAETARRVFMRGLMCELEDIALEQNAIAENDKDREQGKLFDLK